MTHTLHAFDGVKNVRSGHPHAVKIELSDEEAKRLDEARQAERFNHDRYAIGEFHDVTATDGTPWRVATAPCGEPCHCAAVAEKVVA